VGLAALRTVLTCLYNKELARILISKSISPWYINNDCKYHEHSIDILREIMLKRTEL